MAKLTLQEVRSIIESKGAQLLSESYSGIRQPLKIRTIDGIVEYRKLVNIKNTKKLYSKNYNIKKLSNNSRTSIQKIKEMLSKHNVELLSNEYINDITPLKIKFPDDVIEYRTLTSIRNSLRNNGSLISKTESLKNKKQNNILSTDNIKGEIESKGGKLLSTYDGWNIPVLVETKDGKKEYKKMSEIRKWNELYSKEYRMNSRIRNQYLPYAIVKEIVESKGGVLLSSCDEYTGNHSPLKIKTKDGHIEYRILSNIQKVNTLLSKSSDFELDIREYIKSLGVSIVENDRKIIEPLEIDIIIPEHKLGIECNGLYWHSDLFKDKKYHIEKTQLMNDNDYSLIHISEYDWMYKQDIIKGLLSLRLGKVEKKIPARKCKIIELNVSESKKFLDSNHLQGDSTQANYRYGLMYENELVSLMTFSKPRFNKNHDYELCRFSNKKNTIVNGAFAKLFNHFIKKVTFNTVISYCDVAHFSGKIYKNNGFKYINRSLPNYKYFKPKEKILESRNKYQKHKLKDKLLVYNETASEYKNMLNNGYLRIWDCGNDVYVYTKEA